jgi:peptidoglycan/LPS O-acetylase OafA/YrhL
VRQEIQGLRAVAVLLVLLFHLWPNRVPGGYIGVDVFFVISGYLITSHILREVDRTGSVRLGDFWARRIRRLLPASYLVLVVSALGVLLLVPTLLWRQFFSEILAAALYVENWTLALNSVDYLAAENTPSPAQHYWTLSAEEQFYLVWPLLVLLGLWLARLLVRRRHHHATYARRWVLLVLGTTVAVSLAYSLWITATNPALSYFVTPARAWEFGAGALLAFAPRATRFLAPSVRAALVGTSLVVLLACSLVLDENTAMPGVAAIWVVLASAAIIWAEDPDVSWSPSRALTWRPSAYVGDISYSVYLWHWPLIILLPFATDRDLTRADKITIFVATLVLAGATKRWVEDPVRRARRFGLARTRTTLVHAAAGALVLTVLCLVPQQHAEQEVQATEQAARALAAEAPDCFGAAARDPRNQDECPNPELEDTLVPNPAAAAEDWPDYGRCVEHLRADPLEPCRFGEPRQGVPHVAVLGDSHARVLMTMVEEMVDAGRVTADMFVVGGCPWSTTPPNVESSVGQRCAEFRERLTPMLEQKATSYDAMLTTARLTTLTGSHRAQVRGMVEAWSQVTEQGVPVVVLRGNPQEKDPEKNPQFCLADTSVEEADRCALDRQARLERWFDSLAIAARRTPGAELVDLTDFYCDEEKCPVVIGGVNVYVDNNHLTVTYARTLAPYLYRELVRLEVL